MHLRHKTLDIQTPRPHDGSQDLRYQRPDQRLREPINPKSRSLVHLLYSSLPGFTMLHQAAKSQQSSHAERRHFNAKFVFPPEGRLRCDFEGEFIFLAWSADLGQRPRVQYSSHQRISVVASDSSSNQPVKSTPFIVLTTSAQYNCDIAALRAFGSSYELA